MNCVENELYNLGMDNALKGFAYAWCAIEIIAHKGFFVKIEKVYIETAKKFNTKYKNVERNIRYSIEKTWEKGNVDYIDKIFGYSIDIERGKPTNREFLFMLADKIKNICE